MTITNSNGLDAEPWCIPTFTSKQLLYHKLFLQLFLHQSSESTYTSLPIITILQLPTYALLILSLLSEQYKSFFQIHKAKIELLSFSFKLLWLLLWHQWLPFMNSNCILSTSICCRILYLKILSTTS